MTAKPSPSEIEIAARRARALRTLNSRRLLPERDISSVSLVRLRDCIGQFCRLGRCLQLAKKLAGCFKRKNKATGDRSHGFRTRSFPRLYAVDGEGNHGGILMNCYSDNFVGVNSGSCFPSRDCPFLKNLAQFSLPVDEVMVLPSGRRYFRSIRWTPEERAILRDSRRGGEPA